jgi:hypothetical protein
MLPVPADAVRGQIPESAPTPVAGQRPAPAPRPTPQQPEEMGAPKPRDAGFGRTAEDAGRSQTPDVATPGQRQASEGSGGAGESGAGTGEGRSPNEARTSPANPDGGGGPNENRGARPTPRDPIIPGLEHPLDTAEREAREAASNAQPARNKEAAEPTPAQKELGRIRDNLVERPRRVLQGYLEGRPPEETGAGLGLTPEQSRNASQVMANHAADLLRRRGFGEDDIRTALTPRLRRPGATSQDNGELWPPRDPIIPGIEHPLDIADREQRRLEALRSKPSAPTPAEVMREQMVPSIADLPKAIILARLEGRTPEEISRQLGITPERADKGGYAIGRQIENTMIDRGIDPAAAREAMTPRSSRPIENEASGKRPSPKTGTPKAAAGAETPPQAQTPRETSDAGADRAGTEKPYANLPDGTRPMIGEYSTKGTRWEPEIKMMEGGSDWEMPVRKRAVPIRQMMADITAVTGNEVALVRLTDGRRVLRMGKGDEVSGKNVIRMIAHTHPSGDMFFSKFDADRFYENPRGPKSSILIDPADAFATRVHLSTWQKQKHLWGIR